MKVAILPARGGSKRIPGKNIRAFAGKPMIAHALASVRGSRLFDRVLVSTDSEPIASVAREAGAEVPFLRPADLSGDRVSTADVIHHALDWLSAHGCDATEVCCVYATAAFLRPEDLRAGLELLERGAWDYVFSAVAYEHPPQRAFRLEGGNRVEMQFPQHAPARTQDLPELFHDAGQFYWGRAAAWKAKAPILGPGSTILRLPRWRIQDIDSEEDWRRAEILFRVLSESSFK